MPRRQQRSAQRQRSSYGPGPLNSGEQAIKSQFGQFLGDVNPATGQRSIVPVQQAMQSMFNDPSSLNYRPLTSAAQATLGPNSSVGFATPGGNPMGRFNQVSGQFNIAGGTGQAYGGGAGNVAGGGHPQPFRTQVGSR